MITKSQNMSQYAFLLVTVSFCIRTQYFVPSINVFISFKVLNRCGFFPDLLRAEEEVRPRVDPARDPPRRDAHVGVVRREVHPGRPLHVLRAAQHLRAHHHVLLLHAGGHGPPHEEVPVVEEVPHHPANGEFIPHIHKQQQPYR